MTLAAKPLTPHCSKVLKTLHKSARPMTAYELLEKLKKFGIKAPPTIYRALETLVQQGLVHRIESLNAFIACHDGHGGKHAQFAVCRSCGEVEEIHDHRLTDAIKALGVSLAFRIEQEMLELLGLCANCHTKAQKKAGKNSTKKPGIA